MRIARTPSYRLTDAVTLPGEKYGEKSLVMGDFVTPLTYEYVPRHVLDDIRWKWFNPDREVFCYTRKGVVPIPKDRIREV